jgi:UTP--glucose-1-phosphate uridylyltransferase
MKIKKAVIPAAGLGTRFLPVTKSMPKEMLPLVDIPAIHYVVEEAVESGINDIIIITGRGKRSIEDYFDESPELEMRLRKDDKKDLLNLVKKISSFADIHYIRQKEPKGLPDAILKAEKHVGDEPFAVLLGDDIIKDEIPCLKQLISIFNKYKKTVIATQKIPIEEIYKYGSIKGKKIESNPNNFLYLIEDIVEKPSPEKAPSNIAAVGRYIFTPDIFKCIRNTKPGINNELQIADSLKLLMQTQDVYAFGFSGKRFDIGDKLGYIEAIIDFSLDNPEIGKDVNCYIQELLKEKKQ